METQPAMARANASVFAPISGGRLSLDTSNELSSSWGVIMPPASPEDTWRSYSLDAQTLDKLPPSRLLELLPDLSPDMSRAVWDHLRLCNPGHEAKALKINSDEPDKKGQKALDAFINRLSDHHGSIDVVYNRLYIASYVRGAFFAELVLNKTGREPIDLATPDPVTARFRRIIDDERGPIWQLGQWHGGKFVPLDRPTVRYLPVDPMPGSPYGRPPAGPALFSTLFLLGLLHDLRRVISQQGYPRLDIEVDLEKILAVAPQTVKTDPKVFKEWVDAAIKQVQDAFYSLEPDQAYVHTSVIKMNRPQGTVDSSSLGAMDGIIRNIERMSVRAHKTMPIMFGINEATAETHANRQWEIQAASIKSFQHGAETLLGRLYGLGMQVQGIACRVVVRFAELRASEAMRDAQTDRLRVDNAARKRDEGFITQDQASIEITTKPAALPQPIVRRGSLRLDSATTENPEPGSNRGMSQTRNAHALALLYTADTPPGELEQTEDIDWFDRNVPDGSGALEPEIVA